MNRGPTTLVRLKSALLVALAMGMGGGAMAGSPSPADPAAGRRLPVAASRLAAHAADPAPPTFDRDLGSSRLREAFDRAGPARSPDVSPTIEVLSTRRGLLLQGWSDPRGQRRPVSTSASQLPGPRDPLARIALLDPLVVQGGHRDSQPSIAPRVSVTTPPTSGGSGRSSEGRPNRNPGPAAGLERQVVRSGVNLRPSHTAGSSLRSPWTVRDDDGEDAGSSAGSLSDLLAGDEWTVLPVFRGADDRERSSEIGAPLGYESLEVAFGSSVRDGWETFVGGRRQDDEAACSAFGREVSGKAGVQFCTGDDWNCRVQISQSFGDALSERLLKPSLSVALRRRF